MRGPDSSPLVDAHGRRMRKLRVSLTDACNLRCVYCMPAAPVFTPRDRLLPAAEIRRIAAALVGFGIEELRLTGGEPTVRAGFPEILEALGGLPVRRKGITTNGLMLQRYLPALRAWGWDRINVSVDSLDAGRFHAITRGGDFRTVMGAIDKAMAMGMRVRVNAVIMRGINDDELEGFAAWAADTGVETRFLEYMRVGPGLGAHAARFVPASEMIARLSESDGLRETPAETDSTALRFATGRGARIGIIASESRPFCANCSRLRLGPTGMLRACVMEAGGRSLRNVPAAEMPELIRSVLAMKPLRHGEAQPEPMHALGG